MVVRTQTTTINAGTRDAGTAQGQHRDSTGTAQGQRRDSAGTAQGHRRDSAGTAQGHRRDGGIFGRMVTFERGSEQLKRRCRRTTSRSAFREKSNTERMVTKDQACALWCVCRSMCDACSKCVCVAVCVYVSQCVCVCRSEAGAMSARALRTAIRA